MRRLVVLVLCVVVLGVVGCGGSEAGTSTTTPATTHTLTGGLVLAGLGTYGRDEPPGEGTQGGPCHGNQNMGYDDIAAGVPVTVTNQTGEIIGATTLAAGWFNEQETANPGDPPGGCVFPFEVAGLPDATFYSVEVGQRGELTYSLSELEAADWTVWSTLGG